MVHSSCFLLDMRRVTHTVKFAKCHVDDQGDQRQGHVDDKGDQGHVDDKGGQGQGQIDDKCLS